MAPPSGKASQLPRTRVTFMHETAGNAPWTAVEILVVTPNRKVRTPIVEAQFQVSCRVRQIKTNHTTFLMPGVRDGLEIERLTRGVVHTAQQDQCNRVSFAIDH